MIDSDVMTRDEAAEFLKVSLPWLIKAQSRTDGPPSYRLTNAANGSVRYLKSELLDWLRNRPVVES